MGLLISFHLCGILLFPMVMWAELFLKIAPYYIMANIVGSLLINFLIGGELSFLTEAESLKIEANTDHLTGLLNRRGINMITPDLKVPTGENKGRALLYFDIDKFKDANDTYGHAAGDIVLKKVADSISENLRKHDVFARIGGDEFAIILPEVDVKEAQMVADRCRSLVAETVFEFDGKIMPVTISLGAVWLHEPSALDVMLSAADDALYQAKSNGRNAVVFLSGLGHGLKSATAPEFKSALNAAI